MEDSSDVAQEPVGPQELMLSCDLCKSVELKKKKCVEDSLVDMSNEEVIYNMVFDGPFGNGSINYFYLCKNLL